jgi:UDP-N-acetylmuramate-alanine ligase
MTIGYVHDPAAGAALVAGLARPGDVAATIGAGDVGAAAPLLLEALRGGRP